MQRRDRDIPVHETGRGEECPIIETAIRMGMIFGPPAVESARQVAQWVELSMRGHDDWCVLRAPKEISSQVRSTILAETISAQKGVVSAISRYIGRR